MRLPFCLGVGIVFLLLLLIKCGWTKKKSRLPSFDMVFAALATTNRPKLRYKPSLQPAQYNMVMAPDMRHYATTEATTTSSTSTTTTPAPTMSNTTTTSPPSPFQDSTLGNYILIEENSDDNDKMFNAGGGGSFNALVSGGKNDNFNNHYDMGGRYSNNNNMGSGYNNHNNNNIGAGFSNNYNNNNNMGSRYNNNYNNMNTGYGNNNNMGAGYSNYNNGNYNSMQGNYNSNNNFRTNAINNGGGSADYRNNIQNTGNPYDDGNMYYYDGNSNYESGYVNGYASNYFVEPYGEYGNYVITYDRQDTGTTIFTRIGNALANLFVDPGSIVVAAAALSLKAMMMNLLMVAMSSSSPSPSHKQIKTQNKRSLNTSSADVTTVLLKVLRAYLYAKEMPACKDKALCEVGSFLSGNPGLPMTIASTILGYALGDLSTSLSFEDVENYTKKLLPASCQHTFLQCPKIYKKHKTKRNS